MPREKWDADETEPEEDEAVVVLPEGILRSPKSIIPDWTRTPLSAGAPSVAHARLQVTMLAAAETVVGA